MFIAKPEADEGPQNDKPTPQAKPPTEAEIEAEIERIAAMSDAAFLALDREALAAKLHCTPSELTTLRRRAQNAARAKALAKAQEVKAAQAATRAEAARAKKAAKANREAAPAKDSQ